jgi:hypothetical protein
MKQQEMVFIPQASRLLGMKVREIYTLIDDGELAACLAEDGDLLIPLAEIERRASAS